ncbi:MAG: hypothetical protein U0931_29940 [Vulcanimicrobiota bacterium]
MRPGFWQEEWLHRLDDEGRWLVEQAAPGYRPDRQAVCPYSDSRQGSTINFGALEQIQRHWSAVCRRVYLRVPPQATLQQAFAVSLELVCAPLLSEGDPIPALEAAIYKACVGFCQVFTWLVLADDQAGCQPLAEFGDGPGFFDWLEREGWLRGGDQVCAGSQEQIVVLYRLFCGGAGPAPALTPVLEAVALQTSLLLSTREAAGRGEPVAGSWSYSMLTEGRAPWLYSVLARPQARPEWARRLLPSGQSGGALETFLRQHSSPTREQLALELLDKMPPPASPTNCKDQETLPG